jgi:hypothetical protein
MNNLPHNNLELFYFTEHNNQSLDDTLGDIENEINIDTQLKYIHYDNIDVITIIFIFI